MVVIMNVMTSEHAIYDQRVVSPQKHLDIMREAYQTPDIRTIEAPSIAEAHRLLGREVKNQVHMVVERRLEELPGQTEAKKRDYLKSQINFSRRNRRYIEEEMKRPETNPLIKKGISEYFESLQAWADGAELHTFLSHPLLKDLFPSNQPITVKDLAFWLQNDNVSCYTGVVRGDNGVYILHTEEDTDFDNPLTSRRNNKKPFIRVDKPRLYTFKIGGQETSETFTASIYPDLLPGPAYSWNEDYFQAIDALYGKVSPTPGAVANVTAWVALRYGNQIDPKEIVRGIGKRYSDGYALISIDSSHGQPEVRALEFFGDKLEERRLGNEPGDNLVQVNIFSQPDSPMTKYLDLPNESPNPYEPDIAGFRKRMRNFSRIILNLTQIHGLSLYSLLRVLSFRNGGELYAFANWEVNQGIAAFIGDDGRREMFLVKGPARKDVVKKQIQAISEYPKVDKTTPEAEQMQSALTHEQIYYINFS